MCSAFPRHRQGGMYCARVVATGDRAFHAYNVCTDTSQLLEDCHHKLEAQIGLEDM